MGATRQRRGGAAPFVDDDNGKLARQLSRKLDKAKKAITAALIESLNAELQIVRAIREWLEERSADLESQNLQTRARAAVLKEHPEWWERFSRAQQKLRETRMLDLTGICSWTDLVVDVLVSGIEAHDPDERLLLAKRTISHGVNPLLRPKFERQVTSTRTGGQNKAGKLKPHNELIRRAMVYDQNRADSGDSEWINGPVRRHKLEEVLSLLEDEDLLNELVEAEPRLALRRIEAFPDGNEDRTDSFVTFSYAGQKDRDVAFSTLRNFIASVLHTK